MGGSHPKTELFVKYLTNFLLHFKHKIDLGRKCMSAVNNSDSFQFVCPFDSRHGSNERLSGRFNASAAVAVEYENQPYC